MDAPQNVTTPGQLVPLMIATAAELSDLNAALRAVGIKKAKTEHEYRRHKSIAMLAISGTERAKNAEMRDAAVHQYEIEHDDDGDPVTVGVLRYRRDLAEAEAQGLLEASRGKRTELSALQTVANALKSEAEFATQTPSGASW